MRNSEVASKSEACLAEPKWKTWSATVFFGFGLEELGLLPPWRLKFPLLLRPLPPPRPPWLWLLPLPLTVVIVGWQLVVTPLCSIVKLCTAVVR